MVRETTIPKQDEGQRKGKGESRVPPEDQKSNHAFMHINHIGKGNLMINRIMTKSPVCFGQNNVDSIHIKSFIHQTKIKY